MHRKLTRFAGILLVASSAACFSQSLHSKIGQEVAVPVHLKDGEEAGVRLCAQEQPDELNTDIAKLDALRSSKNLESMQGQIDQDSEKWRSRDRNVYLLYMYRACGELSSYDIGDISQRALLLSKYSTSVLAGGEMPLPQYIQFVEFLGFDPPQIDASAWKRLRREKAIFWLEAGRRLEHALDAKFDFNDRPLLNVAPPLSTGLPAGVSPASIQDPQLRGEYENAIKQNHAKIQKYNEQSWLKLNRWRVYGEVEHYLVNAYAKPPSDLPEIKMLLSEYIDDASIRERLMKEILKTQDQ